MTTINNNTNNNTNKHISLLIIIACTSKIFGFVRDIVLANAYGASYIADVFITTLSVPEIVMDILAQTVTIGYIPIAIALLVENKNSINRFTSSVLKMFFLIGLLFAISLFVCPKLIIRILAPGFTDGISETAQIFLQIISLTVIFRTITNILNAFLNTCKCFVPGAFFGIILDISIIISIILSKKCGWCFWLPLGALFGTALQMIIMILFAKKNGLKIVQSSKMVTPETKKMLLMIIPAVMAAGVLQITGFVNKALASKIIEGGVTMLNYSNRISFFAENILVASVATVLYPTLSELYVTKNMDMFKKELSQAINKLIVFLIPAGFGLACLSYEIIKLLYGHGAFDEIAVKQTALLMSFNVIGICGIAIQSLLSRALFSMKKVKVSMIISISLLFIFVSFSFFFSKLWALEGIAIATGISYLFGGLTYYIVLNNICGNIGIADNVITLLKSLFASLVMAFTIIFLKKPLSICPNAVSLILLVLIGIVVYFLVAQILKIKEASFAQIRNLIK